jgi:sarcosine oxidase subunit delta
VRDEPEFVCGGPSHITRPSPEADDRTWTAYLFNRANQPGTNCERWLHLYGCGRWFNVARDTVTHEIRQVYAMGTAPPDLPNL